jgi:hypothetical protein
VTQKRILPLESGSNLIPSYVNGSLVRNGPTIWSAGEEYYGHLFDGAAKLTKFDIDGTTQTVRFSSRLLGSRVLDSMLEQDKILPAVSVGPILKKSDNEPVVGGSFRIAKNLWNTFLRYDNCVVNVWDYNPRITKSRGSNRRGKSIWATTDTAFTAKVNLEDLTTEERGTCPPAASNRHGFEFLLTAHPEYDKKGTGASYNVNAEITQAYGSI